MNELEQLQKKNDEMLAQILADLKEINEMNKKTLEILHDVAEDLSHRP